MQAADATVVLQDYLLWNRLGSSLSNGNRPEDALGAYREALQMRPTYTRAIYNVGVACMFFPLLNCVPLLMVRPLGGKGLNIGAHKEAAEHVLSALALQDTTEGEKSEQLWFTLRRALNAMVRLLALKHRKCLFILTTMPRVISKGKTLQERQRPVPA